MNSRKKNTAPDSELEAQHARVFDLLAEYASAQLLCPSPEPAWRELEAHVARCQRCGQELVELRSALLAEIAGGDQGGEPYPDPDLSFLPDLAAFPHRNGLVTTMRSLVVELSAALVAGLRPPRLLGSLRGSSTDTPDDGNRPPPPAGWNYRVPGASESELSVLIEIEPTGNDGQLCRVLVTVDDPADPLPQRESEVTLQYEYVTRNAVTDRGTVAFPAVPLAAVAQMRVAVTKLAPP